MAKENSRFFKKELEKTVFTTTQIWIDKETGVNYLYHIDTAIRGSGLTPLLDKDGKPVITPPEELEKLD